MSLRTRWKTGDRFLVRYKDAALLVVEKKAGVLSQRTETGRGEDMLTLVREFLGPRVKSNNVFPVHRLDRAVSGLLVYARQYDVQQDLIAQFTEHSVDRTYVACVKGLIKEDQGVHDSWLYTEDKTLVVYSVEDDDPRPAKRAITHWRVLERFKESGTTLIEAKLETGLRNQIRVHFAEAGHPLLGDRKYGNAPRKNQSQERIFLHAAELGFEHPLSRERKVFTSALPPDLKAWKESLQERRRKK